MFDTISWFGSGAAGSSALDKSKNLADVANPQQALDNLSGASKAELEALQDSVDAKADVSDVSGLMLSKLGAGRLWFNRGVLSVASFANLPVSLPISLCIEYDADSWEGLGSGTGSGIIFLGNRDVEYTTPAQFKGFFLRYYESGEIFFHCANADATPLSAQFSAQSTTAEQGFLRGGTRSSYASAGR